MPATSSEARYIIYIGYKYLNADLGLGLIVFFSAEVKSLKTMSSYSRVCCNSKPDSWIYLQKVLMANQLSLMQF